MGRLGSEAAWSGRRAHCYGVSPLGRAAAGMARRVPRCLPLAVVLLLTSLVSLAPAATVVTGDHDTSAPLVITPDTDPFVAVVNVSTGPSVAFIQNMPVTKRISQVTVGDLASGSACSANASVKVRVWRHDPAVWGPPGGSGTTSMELSSPVTLSATQSRITFAIPPITLRKGQAYSFSLAQGDTPSCQFVAQRSWSHNGATVNSGPSTSTCQWPPHIHDWPAEGGLAKMMWHQEGTDDRDPSCAGNPFAEWVFAPSMPTGWLLTVTSGSTRAVSSFTTATSTKPPNTDCPMPFDFGVPHDRGVEAAFWKITGSGGSTRWNWVCRFTQFAAPNTPVSHGWYHGAPWWTASSGAPRDVYLRLDTIDYDALLERHMPNLKYDSQERYFADSAATITDNYYSCVDPYETTNTLRSADGGILAAADEGCFFGPLSLDFLRSGSYPSEEVAQDTDYLDEIDEPERDAARFHADSAYSDRIYGHVVHDGTGTLWLQYWFFYYYNDQFSWDPFLPDVHEGDWEMIQIRLNSDLTPSVLTYARHQDEHGRCTWAGVEKSPTNPDSPTVYVARSSHAAYFSAGSRGRGLKPADNFDGLLTSAPSDLVSVSETSPSWVTWPGQWGADPASPPGPAQQVARWNSPAGLHESASDECGPSGSAARVSRVSKRAAVLRRRDRTRQGPQPPRIQARLVGNKIVVKYSLRRLSKSKATRARGLLVTVHAASRGSTPLVRRMSVGRLRGRIKMALPRGHGPYVVRAAAVTAKDLRGRMVVRRVRP